MPGKNIRPIAGKPLIAHSIEAGLKSRLMTKVIVSTDSAEIAEVSVRLGAEVPFLRPAALATDNAPTYDVIRHALDHLRTTGYEPDLVVILQPTSPLRTEQHVDAALNLFQQANADSLASICEASHSPYWMRTIDDEGYLQPFVQGTENARRQDLPPAYQLNGAIYITTPDLIARGKALGENVLPYLMKPEHSVDIDTELDFLFAEFLLVRQERESAR